MIFKRKYTNIMEFQSGLANKSLFQFDHFAPAKHYYKIVLTYNQKNN